MTLITYFLLEGNLNSNGFGNFASCIYLFIFSNRCMINFSWIPVPLDVILMEC